MLSDEEKKEMFEDAKNPKIKDAFQLAERKRVEWIKKHAKINSLDNYIEFLDSLQEVFGPFPVSKETNPPPYYFKL